MRNIQQVIVRFHDAGTPAGNPVTRTRTVVKTPKFPKKSDDFVAVTKKVFTTWAANPTLTLLWLSQQDFEAAALRYEQAQSSRSSAGGNRESTTQIIRNIDRKAVNALPFVKGYIREKWEYLTDAQAQYARYGLEKRGGTFSFAKDRQRRLAALALMINAIETDGFSYEKYGVDFWKGIREEYYAALNTAGSQDGTVSTGVSTKRNMRADLEKGMTALQNLIRANYPDDVAAKFREWGWQKEDY